MEAQREVHLNVSHVDLSSNSRSLSKDQADLVKQIRRTSMSGLKKTKERVFKEITYKLEVIPIKLKQTRAGSKMGSRKQPKDKGVKQIT